MVILRRNVLMLVAWLLIGGLGLSAQTPNINDQNPTSPTRRTTPPRVTAKDSIVVGARLTPEEIEDGKINEAYQPLYHLKRPGDCEKIMNLCETQIIPLAEKSKFEETRNKFLFLANRSIAGCELDTGRHTEAEQRYQKLFDYVSVWPGKTDSAYPQIYSSIGSARLLQGRWKEAQAALEKSIEIFEEQIEKALHSDSEFSKNEYSRDLKMSEAQARHLLAAAYFRDGRQAEAIDMLEKAYQEAIQSSATPVAPELIQRIIESGRTASAALGDATAKAKWDARTPPTARNSP